MCSYTSKRGEGRSTQYHDRNPARLSWIALVAGNCGNDATYTAMSYYPNEAE